MIARIFFIFVQTLLFSAILQGQVEKTYNQLGQSFYENDQLDSASHYFQLAYSSNDPTTQVRAIQGQVNVAIQRSKFDVADSLLVIGDEIIKKVEPKIYFDYQLTRGDYFRAASKFPEALATFKLVLSKSYSNFRDSLLTAEALLKTALTYERMANYDASLIYIDSAYSKFKLLIDTSDYKYCAIYNSMGNCYFRSNQFEKAKEYYIKSKIIAESENGNKSINLAMTFGNLSSISRMEGNLREAINYSLAALNITKALRDENRTASNHYALGIYHYFIGDYGRAKDHLEACLEIRQRILPEHHYLLAGPYEVLGIIFEESGDYPSTLKYFQKSKDNRIANLGKESMEVAFNNENIGLCYKAMGQLDSALHYIVLSNRVLVKKFNKPDFSLGTQYYSYAQVLYLMENYLEAEKMLQKSNRIYEGLNMQNSVEFGHNLALAANISFSIKKYNQAKDLFQSALSKISHVENGLSVFQYSPQALEILDDYLAFLYDNYKIDNDAQILSQFEIYSDIYLQLSDNFRKQFNDSYTKSILIKNNTAVYHRNVGIYYELYQSSKASKHLEAAFNFSEYSRTALLRDIQNENIQQYAGIPDSVLTKERKLKKQISDLNKSWIENPDIDSLKSALFQSKETLNNYIDNTLKDFPNYYKLKYGSSVLSLDSVQSKLSKGQNIIEYMQDDTAYYAVIINPHQLSFLHIGNKTIIDSNINSWKENLYARNTIEFFGNSNKLYQKLWLPLERHLKGERITIIPTGTLFYLNFETLNKGSNPADYLIHKYNISYAASCNMLYANNDSQASKSGKIVAIAPGFEDDLKASYKQNLDASDLPDQEFLQTVRQPWSLNLVQSFSQNPNTISLTADQATEANIKQKLPLGKIIHFATHAIANESDPLRSRLILSKDIGEQLEDGYLHAYEIYGIPLEADLAILSACESGIGQLQKGEGMISLAYSMKYAGCPSTTMSLWKVDEKSNTSITKDFIENLQSGFNKSEALRQAKLDYLKNSNSEKSHPFYWAGMVLMGQDGIIEIEKNGFNYKYLFGLGILLFIFLFFQYSKKKKSIN